MRAIAAAVLAATAVFFWGFVYWTLLPTGMSSIQGPPQNLIMQKSLDLQLPESGVYLVPFSAEPESDTSYHKAHKEGPLAMIYFRKEGAEPMAPSVMGMGWLQQLLSVSVMVVLLTLLGGGLSFGQRFLIVFLGGVAGSVLARFGDPIWWYHSWDMAWTHVIYEGVSWLLAGLVLAGIVRPGPPKPSPTQL